MKCIIPESSMSEEVSQIFATAYLISSVCGIVGNSLSMICLSRLGATGNRSNTILKYLVMSDLYISLVGMPLMGIGFANRTRDCVYHNFVAYVNIVGTSTSSTTVLMLAFERYTLLTKPHTYDKFMTKKKINALLIALWCAMVVGILSRFFLPAMSFVILLVIYMTVIIGLPISYLKIIKCLKRVNNNIIRHQKPSGQTTSKNTETVNNRGDKKVTFKIMLVIFGYYFTTVPFSILNIPYALGKMDSYIAFVHGSMLLGLFNSCMNPVIYFATDKRIRAQFTITFLRRRRVHGNIIIFKSSRIPIRGNDRMTPPRQAKINDNAHISPSPPQKGHGNDISKPPIIAKNMLEKY